ncbi:protein kinase domain-containing protein [Kitasatospora mediocidica]|uniref:serine/threonine-protein kinase n=1 Tax=Kitasatospora mediocidica TaxID=58352 RepID=UPI00068B5858|nr:serine/threonine-protein kinase [Kitasatospora mediocidica]
MPFQPLEPTDPDSVGPYRLLARLGAGGMGRVYLARSTGGRTVAVKVVRAELAEDPEFRERFRREVSAAQAVSGAYTAPVVDADRDGPTPWLATAYVLGPSLSEAVAAHGPLPVPAVRALGAGLAEALAAVHAAGLIHRDLKPSNVLLAADGPRVIDFGIARALEGDKLTSTGVVVGSPGFMCPEQAGGAPMGPPGDVFSLGSVLVFAATGAGPFSGSGEASGSAAALLYRVIHDEPTLSGLPDELWPTLTACLAKNPADRPTPAELAQLLGGGQALRRGGWLPSALSSDIATHAATVMDMETPARGVPAAADPRRTVDHPRTELDATAPARGTVRLTAAADTPAATGGTSRRRLLAGGGAALVAALGGTAWALSGSAKPVPHPAPQPTHPSTSPTPATTRAPGVPPVALWNKQLPGVTMGATPLCVGSTVYFYAVGGIWAFDVKSGAQRWSKPDQSTNGLAATAASAEYYGSDLVSIDPATGSVLWTYSATPAKGATARLDPDTVLAADDRAVYALCSFAPLNGSGNPDPSAKATPGIFALSRKDGSVLWSQHRAATADTVGISAAVTKDLLLYTDTQKNLVARSLTTGEQLWFVNTDSHASYQLSTDGDRVYCSAAGYGLQAVGVASTKQVWVKSPPAGSKDLWYSAPAVADGVVYTVLGGMTLPEWNATPSAGPTVIAYRATDGTELWRLPLPNEVSMDTTPVLVQQTLFVSTDSKGIYAIDIQARKIRWIYQVGVSTNVAWSFSTDGSTLIAVQDDRVYALPAV